MADSEIFRFELCPQNSEKHLNYMAINLKKKNV